MFLKRSLVVMVGVLVFIAAFLLKFRLSDQHLENTFRQERVKYGVEDTVLTAPYAEPPVPPAPASPPPSPVSAASTESAPATASSPDASTSSSSSPDESAPPSPGTSSDTNLIIGPVPPSATNPQDTPTPGESSAPAAPAAPSPDTNAGPMMPPASTWNDPRAGRASFLEMAAYRPGEMAAQLGELETAQETNAGEVERTSTNAEPHAAPMSRTNASAGETNSPVAAAAPVAGTTTNRASAPAMMSEGPGASAHAAATGGRAIVLGYHQFTGPGIPSKNIYSMSQDVFTSEMQYLRDNGYHVVPLSDVVRFVKHEISLPPNAVAITIDDGYKSSIVYAGPVLKQFGYPWTYFVYPQFITRTEGKGAASWPDLVELGKEGVDVECHSMTHPQLSKHTQKWNGSRHLLSPEEYDQFLTNETFTAKAILEKELNKKIKYFAYPYGDYNKEVEAKAIAAGFEAIFTVAGNPVHITTDVYSIGRYIITKPDEPKFAGYLHQGALSLAKVDPSPGATTSNPLPVITAVLGFPGDPAALETEVRGFGTVPHDFDPNTSMVRLYLQHPLVASEVAVTIRDKDAQTGQVMVANWHFNYEPSGEPAAPVHQPIPSASATNAAPAGMRAERADSGTPSTNSTQPAIPAEPALSRSSGTSTNKPSSSP